MKSNEQKVVKPKPEDRVQIWNTFFKLSWEETRLLYEITTGEKIPEEFNPLGGTLPPEEFHRLAALVLCTLAIEARVNHLIDELEEEKKLDLEIAEIVRRFPTELKWFLLPKLARKKRTLNAKSYPHKAIHDICRRRNDLIHVNYKGLKEKLPSPKHTIKLFENFVVAMENMNVVLGRIRKERKKVVRIGQFETKKLKPSKSVKEG